MTTISKDAKLVTFINVFTVDVLATAHGTIVSDRGSSEPDGR